MNKILSTLLLLVYAIWFGSATYFTAFAANELFQALPVDTAGAAVGALFPTFFALCTWLALVGLILYWWLGRRTQANTKSYKLGLAFATLGFILSAINEFGFLPHIQQLEQSMGPISKAPAHLVQQFGMVHGISMLVQLVELICCLLVWLCLAMSVQWQWTRRPDDRG